MQRISTPTFCLALLFGSAFAAQAADQALIDAAKKEGSVTWYTTLIVNQTAQPAADAFEKKYGIKVNYIRNDSTEIVIRVLNEAKAGQVQADLMDGVSGTPVLKRAGVVENWLPDVASQLPKEYSDPERGWIATSLYIHTIAYNTDLVKKDDAPKTLDDLLAPKWKGKMALSASPSSTGVGGFVGFVLLSMGEERGVDYLKKFGAQNPNILQVSTRQVVDQMMAGEYPLAPHSLSHHIAFSANRGAPIAWIPTKPAALSAFLVLTLFKGPHRNAGKLMVDFLMSEEGQAIFRDADYIPVLPNVPPKDPSLRPDGVNFKSVYITPELIDQNQKKWMDLYQQYLR
jgi:ABC-type Fe3+ transport system substrate-binding protein